jgi:hypothetical protein
MIKLFIFIHSYSCCSHLEHRTSVKRFVSLKFLNLWAVGRTPWTGISPSQGRYLHRTTQTQNKRRQTSMPRVGFEPMTPVFEQAKTIHALDRAATVIGSIPISLLLMSARFINKITRMIVGMPIFSVSVVQ